MNRKEIIIAPDCCKTTRQAFKLNWNIIEGNNNSKRENYRRDDSHCHGHCKNAYLQLRACRPIEIAELLKRYARSAPISTMMWANKKVKTRTNTVKRFWHKWFENIQIWISVTMVLHLGPKITIHSRIYSTHRLLATLEMLLSKQTIFFLCYTARLSRDLLRK